MASFEKIVLFVAVLIGYFFMLAENQLNINILEEQCLVQTVEETGEAERTIKDVLDLLLDKTADNGYNYEWDVQVGDNHSWGNGACNGVLEHRDCTKYLRVAKDLLIQGCPFVAGAHIKLADCQLRYEPNEFLGRW